MIFESKIKKANFKFLYLIVVAGLAITSSGPSIVLLQSEPKCKHWQCAPKYALRPYKLNRL